VRPHICLVCVVLMVMNTIVRRILLGLLAILAIFVGLWAAAFPASFYSSFPGLGLRWVSSDGPFNEHLIRDVGALYLGFAAAAVAAMFSRSAVAGRVVGVGWSLFGVLHISYHLGHPEATTVDQVGTIVSLAVDLLLGLLLLLPGRRAITDRPAEVAR
jgi:hypothetical protein